MTRLEFLRGRQWPTLCLVLLGLLFLGCGGGSDGTAFTGAENTSPPPVTSSSRAEILVKFSDERLQANVADGYRFIGLDRSNRTLYGPTDFIARPEISLKEVPVEVTSLLILPLRDRRPIGAFSRAVSLHSGFFTVEDPLAGEGGLQSLSLAPETLALSVGESQTFAATGRFRDGAVLDLSDAVEWTVTPSDQASISASGSLTALAAGDAVVRASLQGVSATAGISLSQVTTTLALASSLNPSGLAEPVTFTSTLSGAALPPSAGEVAFYDGASLLGRVAMNQGVATFQTPSLNQGSHFIRAVYEGDARFAASSSSTLTQVVGGASLEVELRSTVNPALFGQAVTLVARPSVGSSGRTPTGTVTFRDGDVVLAADVPVRDGEAQADKLLLAVGSHAITAHYSGDSVYPAAISSLLTQIVAPAITSVSVASSNSPSVSGTLVTFTANVVVEGGGVGQPTGSITFLSDGTTLGTQPVVAGQATLGISSLGVGTRLITAVYSGDGNFNGSTATAFSQKVEPLVSGVSLGSSSRSPSQFGTQLVFTATVSSAGSTVPPTGTVSFYDGTTLLAIQTLSNGQATFSSSTLPGGNYSITAVYSGDGSTSAGSSPVILHRILYSASLVVRANPSSFVSGRSVTLTATVRTLAPGPSSLVPNGEVTISNDNNRIGTVTLDASGSGSLTTTALTSGNLVAVFNGGDSHFGSAFVLTVMNGF